MIHRIKIENFSSIAHIQDISLLVPKNVSDMPNFKTCTCSDDTRIPVTVGFFGANASGKSTVLRAISNTILFILGSFGSPQNNIHFQPYRQKSWWVKPTKILIEFDAELEGMCKTTKFQYELHISHTDKFDDKRVLYEALSYSPEGRMKKLFERKEQKFSFSKEFGITGNRDPRKESIRNNASVISTLAAFNHTQSITLVSFFSKVQTNIIGTSKIPHTKEAWLSTYYKNPKYLEELNTELQRLDLGLESMTIQQGNTGLFATFQHFGLDEHIFLEEESNGTKRFIEIFPQIYYALEQGSIVLIDEIDTDIHPLLLPEILRWFNSEEKNTKNSQLIFTAHNPALLDELEKEQIFFSEKKTGQPTSIYSAKQIQGLRRHPSLMKKYLSGELGAIPHIG